MDDTVKKIIQQLIDGSGIIKFLHKHKVYVFVLFLLFLGYIGNRYSTERVYVKINKIRKEIDKLKSKSIYYESELTKIGLKARIPELVKQRNLDLAESDEPPMYLIVTKEDCK